jgi:6-phosphogluconolactonase
MAREAMLDRVPIPSSQIHPLCQTPQAPEDDAARYARLLDEQLPAAADGMPVFDLILLGMGGDGHTASLFPGTPILDERSHSVAAVHVPKLDSWRVSLTLPVLEHARRLLFLVAGSDKAAMVERVLGGANGEPVPVQRIQAGGEVEWHLDADAAALLDAEATS